MYAKSVFKYQVYLYGSEAFCYLLTNLSVSANCWLLSIYFTSHTRILATDFPTESVSFSRWVFVLLMRLQLVNVLPHCKKWKIQKNIKVTQKEKEANYL